MPIVLTVVLLVALGTVLAHSEPRMTGTNSVPLRGQGVGLRHDEQLCQGNQLMPKDSGRMRMFGATDEPGRKPELLATIRQPRGRVLARSRSRWRDPGVLDFAIDPPVRRARVGVDVCLRNTGRETVVLTGILTQYGDVVLNRKKLDVALTTLWFTPEKKTWLSELGAIIPRVGHARIGGVWAFWVVALLFLSAIGLALTTALRANLR